MALNHPKYQDYRISGENGICSPRVLTTRIAVFILKLPLPECGRLSYQDTSDTLLVSHSVLSDSLQPYGLQHTRLPCPSSSPRVCSNSYPSSRWCHPTISSSVVPFSAWLQSFPASGSVLMSGLFTSGGQSIGVLVSASVLPVNIQDWFP